MRGAKEVEEKEVKEVKIREVICWGGRWLLGVL